MKYKNPSFDSITYDPPQSGLGMNSGQDIMNMLTGDMFGSKSNSGLQGMIDEIDREKSLLARDQLALDKLGSTSSTTEPSVVNLDKTTDTIPSGSFKNKATRNNNPGNLEHGSFTKKHGATSSDGRFAIFDTPEQGLGAMKSLLKSKNYKDLTIKKAIARYAPAFENNTQAYINSVAKAMRVSENTPLAVTKNNLKHLVIAMSKHENGGNYISDELFEKAYRIS